MGKSLFHLLLILLALDLAMPFAHAAGPTPAPAAPTPAAPKNPGVTTAVIPAAIPNPNPSTWSSNTPLQMGFDPSKTVTEVDAPCKKDGDTSPTSFGLRPCSVFIPEAVKVIEKRIHNQTDCFYKGKVLDPTALDPKTKGALPTDAADPATQCPGPNFGKETCNVAPGHFNDEVAEITANHTGLNCGTSVEMHVSCSLDGSCTVTPDATGDYGTQEDAYTRGTMIAALGCYNTQVTNGITVDGKVKVAAWGNQIGPCGAIATDYVYKMAQNGKQGESLTKALKGQPNIADIENCPDAQNQQKGGDDSTELGKDRQSACLLRAARHATEALYEHLAVCEVMSRASYSRDKFLDAFFDRLTCPNPGDKQNCVDPTVKKRIKTIIKKCENNPSDASATKCYRRVYLGLWEGAQGIPPTDGVKTTVGTPLWPEDGNCSTSFISGLTQEGD